MIKQRQLLFAPHIYPCEVFKILKTRSQYCRITKYGNPNGCIINSNIYYMPFRLPRGSRKLVLLTRGTCY